MDCLDSWVHNLEENPWVQGEQEDSNVAVGQLRGKVKLSEDLIRSVDVAMVVRVALDSEEHRGADSVPGVLCSNTLVDSI